MSNPLDYELHETIEGVTFTYRSRGADPFVADAPGRRSNRGDYEDVLLWANGDDPAMLIVDARPVTFDVVSVLTYQGKTRFSRYNDRHGEPDLDAGRGPDRPRPGR